MAQSENPQKNAAASAADTVKRHASAGAERLREGAEERAEKLTSDVGDRAGDVAQALHSAGESLRGKEDWLADAAEAAARRLAQISETARDKGFGEVRGELERVARERPALFMGAAVAAGVARGRALRSSAHGHRGDAPNSDGPYDNAGAGTQRPASVDTRSGRPDSERRM